MLPNLDWTKDLGDAFLGQEDEVPDTIQRMRANALTRAAPSVATFATSRASADRITTGTRSDYPRADKSLEARKPRYMQECSPTHTVSS
jgi:hypothetical protein